MAEEVAVAHPLATLPPRDHQGHPVQGQASTIQLHGTLGTNANGDGKRAVVFLDEAEEWQEQVWARPSSVWTSGLLVEKGGGFSDRCVEVDDGGHSSGSAWPRIMEASRP